MSAALSSSALNRRLALAGLGATLLAPGLSWAQAARPLRLVVAGPAGASADLVARLFADEMTPALNQACVVDPKPGAAGMLAVGDLLQSGKDGSSALVGVNSLVSEIPHIVKVRHDMARDIVPVAELARGGLVLVAHPGLAAQTVPELVALAKRQPGQLNYASYSAGTWSHVLGQVLNKLAGVELVHVAYKGSTPALTDVMGGHVPLMFDGLATSLPLIRAGKLRALAVSMPQRTPLLPQVPTFAELGYDGMTATAWMGLWAAAGTPEATQARWRAAALAALQKPALRQKLQEAGFDPGSPRSTAELQQSLKADHERVGAVLKAIDFKPD